LNLVKVYTALFLFLTLDSLEGLLDFWQGLFLGRGHQGQGFAAKIRNRS
jgi:hypothetical protein